MAEGLRKITNYITNAVSDILGDVREKESNQKIKEVHKWDSIGDLISYESYDEENEIYINRASIGFVLEVGVLTGVGAAIENELASLFQNILPAGVSIQISMVASPAIEDKIEYWRKKRNEKPYKEVLKGLNDERADYMKSLGKQKEGEQVVRDFRLIISVSKSSKNPEVMELMEMKEVKLQVKSLFETVGSEVAEISPEGLIRYLDEYMNCYRDIKSSDKEWNKYERIGSQIVNPNNLYEVTDEGLELDRKHEFRSYSVVKYPRKWTLGGMGRLIGDALREAAKVPCPFVTHLGVYICESKTLKTKLMAKASRVEAQAASSLGNWIPSLRKEADEWSFVRDQFDKGERLVKVHYQIILMEEKVKMTRAESKLGLIYVGNGWQIQRDQYIGLPAIICSLPMMWGEGAASDMDYLKRTKTSLSYEPVNTMPIQAEWKGTGTPGLMLTGRRGQLFYWYPFDNKDGNFNVSIAGRPGSGKSFFMQDMATSVLSLGGRVYVLDMGRSFEKQVKRFGGQYLEFTTKTNISLNPFTTIDDQDKDAISDSLGLLKPIIAMMVAPKSGTSDFEDSLIEKALTEVWTLKGRDAGIGDIGRWFEEQEDNKEICKRLAVMLYPYTEKGVYGRYFNGKSNVNLNDQFCVVELEELKSKPELQAVVMQILIVTITNTVILGKRKFLSSLIFDEAWNMLSGSKTSEFMNKLARTLRKYDGSLIAGTQTLDDFYDNAGAKAVFMNSDWLCMFSQKKESVEQLKSSGRFKIDEGMQRLMGTIRTKQGKYSEVMIIHETGASIGRLIADPYSKILYSSKAEEFRAVEELVEKGMGLEEAIREVARVRYG